MFRSLLLAALLGLAAPALAAPAPAPHPAVDPVIADLQSRADSGDVKAMTDLGVRYGKGEGVAQDLPKAIALLRAASDKNDPDAEFFLGTAYSSGTGVPQSDVEAMALYQKAADQGHADSEYIMGTMVAYGKAGILPSWSGAFPFFWGAAVQNSQPAMMMLGTMYQQGQGVERNPHAAAYWYRRADSLSRNADNQGHNMRAVYNLSQLIGNGEVEWEEGDFVERPDNAKVAPAKASTK